MKKINIVYIALSAIVVFAACKKNNNTFYTKLSDDRLPIIVSNTNFTTPAIATTGATTVTAGTNIAVELDFLQTDPISQIQFLQKIGTADSTVISTTAYAPAFSKSKQSDTLLYNYVVPAATIAPAGTSITVRGRVLNQNGLFRDRLFTFKTK